MTLLVEVQARTSVARLGQLTNKENPQGLLYTPLAGTVTVTAGSLAVLGAGTSFTSMAVGSLLVFGAQPGVGYVVASIADNTHLTLDPGTTYSGLTTAGSSVSLAGINPNALQDAVQDAQAHFETEVGGAYDDTTVTNRAVSPPVVNRCHWVGVPLVIAYLYEQRAHPWPDAEVAKAWEIANRRLAAYRANNGSAAWAPPASDSLYTPSGPPQGLPDFDNDRLGRIVPNDPRGRSSSGSVNDWTG